jgi:hypothetical protein
MKTTFATVATLLMLLCAAPAHAALWDFSWLTTAMFGRTPGGDDAIRREASATTTATISPNSNGITVNFSTPAGLGDVSVSGTDVDPVTSGHLALGGAPMFLSRDGELSIVPGTAIGSYSFTGAFADPDRFTIALRGGGSGPAGVQGFLGTGTRQTVSATEPTLMLLVAGALATTAWMRRRKR